jgi:hypothetical protein
MHMGTTPQPLLMTRPTSAVRSPHDFLHVPWPNAPSAVSPAQTENDWFALGRPLQDEHYFAVSPYIR